MQCGGVYVLELIGSLLYLGDQLLVQVLPPLLPFVADLRPSSVELLQELPEVDVENLEIFVLHEVGLTFVPVEKSFIVYRRRERVPLGHICESTVII